MVCLKRPVLTMRLSCTVFNTLLSRKPDALTTRLPSRHTTTIKPLCRKLRWNAADIPDRRSDYDFPRRSTGCGRKIYSGRPWTIAVSCPFAASPSFSARQRPPDDSAIYYYFYNNFCTSVKTRVIKVKVSHTRYRTLGPELSPVYRQSVRRRLWVIHPEAGCHYIPPGLRLPSQPHSITAPWSVPSYTAWWQRHIGVNNLPKVVTQPLPRVGFEPTTCWLQVQRSAGCATAPGYGKIKQERKHWKN